MMMCAHQREWHAPLQVGANLLERDEKALVVSTGYFGDRFADWYLQPCACAVLFIIYYYYCCCDSIIFIFIYF
jgi:hypothetical protein